MRFEIQAPPEAFALIPPADSGEDETAWIREQIEAYRDGPVEAQGLTALDYGDEVARAARLALDCRAPSATDLFFRPIDRLRFGVVHVAVSAAPEGLGGGRDLVAWVLEGIETRVDPVVAGFSTDAIREGWRVHYVTTRDDADGNALAGFAFAFAQDGVLGVVYSELADLDSTSDQIELAVPLVASLRLVA